MLRILMIFHTFNTTRPMGDPSVWFRCSCLSSLFNKPETDVRLLDQRSITVDFAKTFDYSAFDAYIFFRPAMEPALAEFLTGCARADKSVAASYDDLTFDVSSWRESSTLKAGQLHRLVAARYKASANAFDYFDRFIVSSHGLVAAVRRAKPDASIAQIENVWPSSYVKYADFLSRKKDMSTPLIGYFGGGASHSADLSNILSAVEDFCKEKNAKLVCPDFLFEAKNLKSLKFVQPFSRATIPRMIELYSRTQMNLAPLVSDRNSRCKSSVKYIESIVTLSPLAATPIPAYAPYEGLESLVAVEETDDWSVKLRKTWEISRDLERVAADRTTALSKLKEINAAGREIVMDWAREAA